MTRRKLFLDVRKKICYSLTEKIVKEKTYV